MNLAEIESKVHAAIDAEDAPTIEAYAEHCAERIGDIGVLLCMAVIGAEHSGWSSVMAVAAQKEPDLADALEKLEDHITRERAAFTELYAQKIDDDNEAYQLAKAELDRECKR